MNKEYSVIIALFLLGLVGCAVDGAQSCPLQALGNENKKIYLFVLNRPQPADEDDLLPNGYDMLVVKTFTIGHFHTIGNKEDENGNVFVGLTLLDGTEYSCYPYDIKFCGVKYGGKWHEFGFSPDEAMLMSYIKE